MSSDEGDAVVQSSVEMAAAYSGPLPPPEWLRQYEEVLPGIADRMMTLVESEVSNQHDAAAHHRRMQEEAVSAGITMAKRGQVVAALLGLSFLVAAVVLALTGNALLGGVIGLADLVGIVVSFTLGLSRRDAEQTHPENQKDP